MGNRCHSQSTGVTLFGSGREVSVEASVLLNTAQGNNVTFVTRGQGAKHLLAVALAAVALTCDSEAPEDRATLDPGTAGSAGTDEGGAGVGTGGGSSEDGGSQCTPDAGKSDSHSGDAAPRPAGAIDVKLPPYGAAGDGVADDSGAIQAAIDQNPNETVLLQDGIFRIAQSISVKSGQTLFGSDAILKAASSLTSTMVFIGGDNIRIDGLVIDGNDVAGTGVRDASGTHGLVVDGAIIRRFRGNLTRPAYGMRLDSSVNVSVVRSTVSNIRGGSNGIGGDSIGANRGILFVDVDGGLVDDCVFSDIGDAEDGDAIQMFYKDQPGTTQIGNITVSKSRFVNIDKRGIKVHGGDNHRIEDNVFYNGGLGESPQTVGAPWQTGIGIVANTTNTRVRNNVIISERAHAPLYTSGGDSNRFEDNYVDVFGYPNTTAENGNAINAFLVWASSAFPVSNMVARNNTLISTNNGILHLLNYATNSVYQDNGVLAPKSLVTETGVGQATFTGTTDLSTRYAGYYRFQAASGAKVPSFPSGDVHAVIVGDSSVVSGVIGNALKLEGEKAYVDFSSTQLELGVGKTLSLWVRPEVGIGNTSPGIFSAKAGGGEADYIAFDDLGGGRHHLVYVDAQGQRRSSAAFSYTQGKWMHVVIVIDANGAPTFYMNGLSLGSDAVGGSLHLRYLGQGSDETVSANAYERTFDEVILLNAALDAGEVAQLHRRTRPGLDVGDTALYCP